MNTGKIKMLIVVFVVVTFCIVTLGVVSYMGSKKEFRKDVENNLNAISNLKVAEIVQWRKDRIGDGSVFLGNQNFSDLASSFIDTPSNPELTDRLGKWLKLVRSAYDYERILLLDTQGNELLSEPLLSTPVPAYLINDINIVANEQKVTFLDFHRDVPDGPIHLGVLVPVKDPGDPDKIIAELVFVINPEVYLYPLINTWPAVSRTAETLLLRREGDSVLFLNELKFQKNTALNLRFPLSMTSLPAARAALANEGIFTGIDYRGIPVISSLRTIPDSPWFMVARMDIKEVYAPLKTKWRTMFIIVVLLILSFASVVFSLWRRQSTRYFHEKYEIERDKVKAAEALRDSELSYRRLFEAARDGILILDAETGMVVDVNPFLIEMLGFSREQFMNKNIWELGLLKDIVSNRDNFEELQQNEYIRYEDKPLKTVDGRRIEVEFISNVYYVDHRKVIQCNIRNITERKLAEKDLLNLKAQLEQRVIERTSQLEAANKELEAFAYSVSHDLRAPLRAVDGFSRIVMEDYGDKLDTEGNRMLGLIRSNTQKMDQLISDLLNLSRVTRGELRYSDINMTQMAISMFNETAPVDIKENISLTVDKLPEAFADPVFIKQVWLNLLSNAIKFTSKKRKPDISIGGKVETHTNTYFIKDNGVGFNQKYGHKLFGVFQRLHKSEDFEGTGVGLAIVQRIINRFGGKVWAEGAEGKGATFYFSLPVKK